VVVWMCQSLLWVHDMVIQWASHQTSFIQAIELHHVHYGLTFRLLDRDEFPGGRMVSTTLILYIRG
jgi:hypothetical protein